MKKIIILLTCLIGINVFATYLPAQKTITVGGRVFTDLTNLKMLRFTFGGANSNCTVREGNGSAGYTPSGSNKFRVLAVEFLTEVVGPLYVLQSDNDVGVASATAFTSPAYIGGDVGLSIISDAGGSAVGVKRELSLNFLVANGKYLSVSGGTLATMRGTIYGYEEP